MLVQLVAQAFCCEAQKLLQVDGRFGKAVQQVVNNIWDKNNPFSWSDDSPAYRVRLP